LVSHEEGIMCAKVAVDEWKRPIIMVRELRGHRIGETTQTFGAFPFVFRKKAVFPYRRQILRASYQ